MKKREKKEVKVMCALLYMMGLCLALGISLRPVAKEAHPEDRLIQNSDKSAGRQKISFGRWKVTIGRWTADE